MTDGGEQYDDHYWDVIAQRQLRNVVDWLRTFVDPDFRKRVWQEGSGIGQYYEESASQFIDDMQVEWLIQEGLSRLTAPMPMIDALRTFDANYRAFDARLPNGVDAVKLESDPVFHELLAEAKALLRLIEASRATLRRIEDDLIA